MKDLTTIVTGSHIDLAIAGWLHAKLQKSQSKRTQKAYADILAQFRFALRQKGLDLDRLDATPKALYDGLSERQVVTLTAQEYVAWSRSGNGVKSATHNMRLATLSSFYEYALLNEFLDYNPMKRVERAKVQPYKSSKSLPEEITESGLAQIDRETQRGKRDYAILSIFLATGRRLSEVAGLEWQDLSISRSGIVTINFPHLKGGKEDSDKLDAVTSDILMEWVQEYYGESLTGIAPDAPLWVSLAPGGKMGKSYGSALSIRSFSDICKKYFGTSRVHATRHTWTKNMLEDGAPLPLIQKKLGHSSLATTGIYATALERSENPHVENIARKAGIKQKDKNSAKVTMTDQQGRIYRGTVSQEE